MSGVFLLTLIVNSIIVIATAVLIGRDARKRGYSWSVVMGWAIRTLFILPLELGLYLSRGRQKPPEEINPEDKNIG